MRPTLDIDLTRIYDNAVLMKSFLQARGINPTAVIKGFNGIDEVVGTIVEAGYDCVASSRLHHLRRVRERGWPVKTLALRIPMMSEIPELVGVCDISFNSQLETIRLINEEAARQKTTHQVVLMRDLGDLREGIFAAERFIETAVEIERGFPNIHLSGIGSNLACYGTVRPTPENLGELADNAREIERAIGRKLEIVSGGASSSVPLAVRGQMPAGINHLRIGAILMYHTISLAADELSELQHAFLLTAEIVEIGEKPTRPHGELGRDCFGNTKRFEDRGLRRRALLAIGAFDVGDCVKLMPLDEKVEVLGGSSDHMIVDIHDSERHYRLGEIMSFRLPYQSVLMTTASESVHKIIHPRSGRPPQV
ncbi:alanine racemase [Deltaproteobacteria bacterium Smac51]|nr:alanine racemase [Deltaproteobacteria bacterium Smac51]